MIRLFTTIGFPRRVLDPAKNRIEFRDKWGDVEQARLTLARKMAAITLIMWKKGVSFDPKQLQRQAA